MERGAAIGGNVMAGSLDPGCACILFLSYGNYAFIDTGVLQGDCILRCKRRYLRESVIYSEVQHGINRYTNGI